MFISTLLLFLKIMINPICLRLNSIKNIGLYMYIGLYNRYLKRSLADHNL